MSTVPSARIRSDAVARDQRGRARRGEVDRVVQSQALELEDVTEASRHEEPEGGAVPLDHRVHGDRRPVHQVGDVAGRDAELRDERLETLEHARRRIGPNRGRFEAGELSRVLVQQAEVRERTTDVDAEPVPWHHDLPEPRTWRDDG